MILIIRFCARTQTKCGWSPFEGWNLTGWACGDDQSGLADRGA
jgi:hypothetical protein